MPLSYQGLHTSGLNTRLAGPGVGWGGKRQEGRSRAWVGMGELTPADWVRTLATDGVGKKPSSREEQSGGVRAMGQALGRQGPGPKSQGAHRAARGHPGAMSRMPEHGRNQQGSRYGQRGPMPQLRGQKHQRMRQSGACGHRSVLQGEASSSLPGDELTPACHGMSQQSPSHRSDCFASRGQLPGVQCRPHPRGQAPWAPGWRLQLANSPKARASLVAWGRMAWREDRGVGRGWTRPRQTPVHTQTPTSTIHGQGLPGTSQA
jgi:hypothetical protein